jgi:hypothetical protein
LRISNVGLGDCDERCVGKYVSRMLVFSIPTVDPSHERSDSSAGLSAPPYTTLGNVLALKFEFTFEFALEFRLELRFEPRLEDGLEGSCVGESFSLATTTASAGM